MLVEFPSRKALRSLPPNSPPSSHLIRRQKIIALHKTLEIFMFAERYEVFKVLKAFALASYARAYEFSIVSGNAKSLLALMTK